MSEPDPVNAGRPQRTESLARELARNLLGEATPPALAIERGPDAGTRRALAPPPSTLVIGRGDEATWVILDDDLSRAHAEIARGWDRVTIRDLGSKNGTAVDGARIAGAPVELRHGATIALGGTVLRFDDPAERHQRGEPLTVAPPVPPPTPVPPGAASLWLFIFLVALSATAAFAAVYFAIA